MSTSLFHKLRWRAHEYSARAQNWLIENQWLPGHHDYQRFIIVCDIRTGSTMLRSFLADHPSVRMFFELFHLFPDNVPFDVKGYKQKGGNPEVVQRRNTDPVKFLKTDVFTRQPLFVQAVGFKLLYTQARSQHMWWQDPPYERWWTHIDRSVDWKETTSDLWGYLAEETDIAIIHLTRENLLKQKVSAQLAKKTGHWGAGATGGVNEDDAEPTVSLNPKHCYEDFEAKRQMQEQIEERFSDHRLLAVTYEQLVENRNQMLRHVQEFIDVPIRPLQTETEKQRKRPLSRVIENYDVLRREMKRTPWIRFFEE
ncbi:sulfotransferase [Salinibacter grassmerensis]|uniref:sulfotransferase n=1 Tax=Salinibacter grassmerensis TaxID=3040353 RepID=UPI0021E764E5|nr:sulfotransferase [Salinibacter grassmerensis]